MSPKFIVPKTREMVLTPFLSLAQGVSWCAIPLEGEGIFFEVLFGLLKSRSQNSFDVHIHIHFYSRFDENE